jgi:hypothetical protein
LFSHSIEVGRPCSRPSGSTDVVLILGDLFLIESVDERSAKDINESSDDPQGDIGQQDKKEHMHLSWLSV